MKSLINSFQTLAQIFGHQKIAAKILATIGQKNTLVDGDFDDVKDNLVALAKLYGLDEVKIILEWGSVEE